MEGNPFRYRRKTDELLVGREVVHRDDAGEWFASLETVGPSSLASLQRALRDSEVYWSLDRTTYDRWGLEEASARLRLTETPAEEFDDEYSIAAPTELALVSDGLVVDVVLELHGTGLDEDDVPRVLAPQLERRRASIIGVGIEGSGSQSYATVRLRIAARGATVYDAWDLGQGVTEFVTRVKDGGLQAESALDLLRAGRADLLIGLSETEWLEAKSRGYDLDDDRARVELAQDVARFANGNSAGLLVIGLTTKKRAGLDIVKSILPTTEPHDAGRYHRTIDQKVFPPLEGLLIENCKTRSRQGHAGYLLAIFVPVQHEELKPVLVHGAIIRGRLEGTFISIVQRRGEHSVAVRPEALHATLAAGRALLRRGELPVRDSE